MAEWYLQQRNEVSGPFSWEELRFVAGRGKIAVGDKVRQGAAGDWVAIENVPGLLSTSTASAAPEPRTAAQAAAVNGAASPASLPVVRLVPAARTNAPAPPPLPKDTPKAERRWGALIVIGAAALLFGILLLLLAGIFANRGAASAGTGMGSGTGGSSHGPSSESAESNSTSAGHVNGEAKAADENVQNDPEPPGNQGPPPPTTSPAADEPNDDSPSPPGVPSGGADGDGLGDAPPRPASPPRSAAVIMPLDDEDSQMGDDSTSSGSSSGSTAEFFQIQGKGRKFVYIVDCSGSMAGPPFMKARAELLRSIDALKSAQSFFVIFFDERDYPQFYPQVGDGILRATAANKGRVQKWVNEFAPPGGGTDPRAALLRALALKPDAIYLLSDGEFDPNVADEVRKQNRRRTFIHTISFITRQAELLLQQIAKESHGTYRFVP